MMNTDPREEATHDQSISLPALPEEHEQFQSAQDQSRFFAHRTADEVRALFPAGTPAKLRNGVACDYVSTGEVEVNEYGFVSVTCSRFDETELAKVDARLLDPVTGAEATR